MHAHVAVHQLGHVRAARRAGQHVRIVVRTLRLDRDSIARRSAIPADCTSVHTIRHNLLDADGFPHYTARRGADLSLPSHA